MVVWKHDCPSFKKLTVSYYIYCKMFVLNWYPKPNVHWFSVNCNSTIITFGSDSWSHQRGRRLSANHWQYHKRRKTPGLIRIPRQCNCLRRWQRRAWLFREVAHKHGLTFNDAKNVIGVETIDVTGYRISKSEIRPDAERLTHWIKL